MSPIVLKEIEDKSIAWFQNSNQYLILEPITAKIVEDLTYNKSLQEIAKKLQEDLSIPFEKAVDFITDIDKKIIKPNQEKKTLISSQKSYQKPDSFKFTKYYKIHSKIFKFQFSNEFEVSLIHPKFAHLEIGKKNTFDFIFQTFNNNDCTYLVIDQKSIGSWNRNDIHYFQGKFSMKIIECIYEKIEAQWIGVFHASAINLEGKSILILGDSGNGKSTSLALLQAYGLHCVADDFVPMDNNNQIHSFPAGISIKKNSLDVLLPFYPELKNSAEFYYKRLNKTVRYLPPKEINYEKSYPCKALLFIKYDSSIEFDLKNISNIEAFQNLIPDSWISPLEKNVSSFLQWFSSLPCYTLTYSNNEKMIHSVRKILKDDI